MARRNVSVKEGEKLVFQSAKVGKPTVGAWMKREGNCITKLCAGDSHQRVAGIGVLRECINSIYIVIHEVDEHFSRVDDGIEATVKKHIVSHSIELASSIAGRRSERPRR